jgi:hypothetical protein
MEACWQTPSLKPGFCLQGYFARTLPAFDNAIATACLTAFVFVGGWLVPIDPSLFQSSTNVLMLLLTTNLLDPVLSGMLGLLGEELQPNGHCRVTRIVAKSCLT